MKKVVLHLAAVPPDKDAQLALCVALFRKLTGKEPTSVDVGAARATLLSARLKNG